MNQRTNITESEKRRILNMHESYKNDKLIMEQSEERNFIKGVQTFLNSKKIYGNEGKPLNVDGKTDHNLTSQTAQAIQKYQRVLNSTNKGTKIAEDGNWGEDTWNAMPCSDQRKLKNAVVKFGDIFDEFLNWIGSFFDNC